MTLPLPHRSYVLKLLQHLNIPTILESSIQALEMEILSLALDLQVKCGFCEIENPHTLHTRSQKVFNKLVFVQAKSCNEFELSLIRIDFLLIIYHFVRIKSFKCTPNYVNYECSLYGIRVGDNIK